jgi:hypothetical protein
MARGRPRKNPNDVLIRSAELIGWALGGIEREILDTKHKLASLTAQAAQLRHKVGAKAARAGSGASAAATSAVDAVSVAPVGRTRRRRKMSPEARKRISDMMKKRWAERRKASK